MKITDIDLDTYVISDLHLGHKTILEFQPNRKDLMYEYENHEDFMIRTFNSVVKPGDKVIILGDIAFKSIPEYLTALNGDKLLIIGNHDKPYTYQPYRELANVISGVTVVKAGLPFCYEHEKDKHLSSVITDISIGSHDIKVMFSHYPVDTPDTFEYRKDSYIHTRMENLSNMFHTWKCDLCIHGHIHNNNIAPKIYRYNINASADNLTECKPIKIRDLLNIRLNSH